MQITAFAAIRAGDSLSDYVFELPDINPHEILIKVHSCGLSHSDVHMIDNDWFCSHYPLVPGHEIIGVVAAIGSSVSSVTVGECVGMGWHNNYCHVCELCVNDEQHLCAQASRTIIDGKGGFASHVVGHESAVVTIPEGLAPGIAAPLLSAGVAVFNPLLEFAIQPGTRVAIIGAGGLGHLAIQFYHAWGCDITAFTQDLSDADTLLTLGAKSVVSSVDEIAILDHLNSFDFILCTVNKPLDWASFLACLKPKGRLHFVGLPLEPLELGVFPLVSKQRCVSGSQSGSPKTIQVMLDFAKQHNILPITVNYSYAHINQAIDDLRMGAVDYRAVIDFTDCLAPEVRTVES